MRMISLRWYATCGALLYVFHILAQPIFSSNGNLIYDESSTYLDFTLNSGDTLFLTDGSLDSIQACGTIIINGVIQGSGKGYSGGLLASIGNGPGGGGTSLVDGCGGGAYGGDGGSGGHDTSSSPGAGGSSYGTIMGMDIDLGSGGGSSNSSNGIGGNGGGGIVLIAPTVIINGQILVNGEMGGGDRRSGGGGAGGGVLIIGDDIQFSGMISANGGNGGIGQGTDGFPNNDSGGGGGGGRVKIFHTTSIVNTGMISVNGGHGGPHGSLSSGEDGSVGSELVTMEMSDLICRCEELSEISMPIALKITESTCNTYNGMHSGGFIEIVENTNNCPTGSAIQYSLNNEPFSPNLPSYNQTNALSIKAACICEFDSNKTSDTIEIFTTPGMCPSALTPTADYELSFGDPCDCHNPRNCVTGGTSYFNDTLTINTGGINGADIRFNSSSDFYLNVLCYGGLSAPSYGITGTMIPEIGNSGIYKIEFWRPSGAIPSVTLLESGSVVNVPSIIFTPSCDYLDCAEPVPSLSQWNTFILSLLLSIFCVVILQGTFTFNNSISSRPN